MRNAKIIASVVLLSLIVATARASEPLQARDCFAMAILDSSTSPYYVLITVVDDRTGQTKTGCITANLLKGAIHQENDLGYDSIGLQRTQEIAINNTEHVFHFSKQAALDNLPMNDTPRNKDNGQKACEIIGRGQSARMADRSGQVIAVP